jgi:hypothetical protein
LAVGYRVRGAGPTLRKRLTIARLESDECLGQPIADLLHPADSGVFTAATRQLLEDDTHTVEVVFRIRDYREDAGSQAHRSMEGKGMLMRERATGEPSHTMWVLKPCDDMGGATVSTAAVADAALHGPPLLCRICDCSVPAAFFEDHAEICLVTHRLQEMADADDHDLTELLSGMSDLAEALASTSTELLTYRGVAVQQIAPRASPASPQELLPGHPLRQLQQRVVLDLLDIVEAAVRVSGNVQDLNASRLSPTSEHNLERLRTWTPPGVKDPALAQLASDVEQLVRRKYASATRLHNATLYANQVALDWQATGAGGTPPDGGQMLSAPQTEDALDGLGLQDGANGALTLQALSSTTVALSSDATASATEALALLDLSAPTCIADRPRPRDFLPATTSSGSPVLNAVPLSPRLGSSTQRPKTQITIKAFEIVKPISKGAFGRCA